MSQEPVANKLADRAGMLKRSRQFFDERNIMEVDCPILTQGAAIDTHIDLIAANFQNGPTRYLHSSPEHGMKRLLAEGLGDIYQLSHVFRDAESGPRHNPEFTLVEWYRLGFSFEKMIEETCDFIALFIGDKPRSSLTYKEAFKRYTGLDIDSCSESDLTSYIKEHNIPHYPSCNKDDLLQLIIVEKIEPHLGQGKMTALTHFPASQAALAQINDDVSMRYEVFYQGWELANGYQELTDPDEQTERFKENNRQRAAMGKNSLPIDTFFVEALKKGLPPCCGVAVGFDRLMMLRRNTSLIDEVIPFSWKNA